MGEVYSSDHRRTQPDPDAEAAAVVERVEVDLAFVRDDLASVGEQRHVEDAREVPAMFGAENQGV